MRGNATAKERKHRMAEYIEKEPLLRKAKELQGGSFSSPLIVEAIEKAPAIEIVRCRDCKYFREYTTEYSGKTEKADGDCHIRRMNSDNEQFVACQYDDFCSYGERREDERN